VPLRVVPEDVGDKISSLVPWQYPLIVPNLVLPPLVYVLKAAFKFNVGELDEELSPPPQADNRTIEAEHKIIDAKFFGSMRYPNRKQVNSLAYKDCFQTKYLFTFEY
jgi:hypothetical protein